MAKSKKAAAQYESGTLAAFAVVGILLIALGVVSLLAVVGGLKGALFTMVKRVMQGLGGGLCLGVSVLLIWAGVLVAFSSGRSMPKRGFLLFTLLFLAVLGIIDLVSRVGQDTLPRLPGQIQQPGRASRCGGVGLLEHDLRRVQRVWRQRRVRRRAGHGVGLARMDLSGNGAGRGGAWRGLRGLRPAGIPLRYGSDV